jgi:hypothetical protein
LIRGANEDIRKALLEVLSGNIPATIQDKETKDAARKAATEAAVKITGTADSTKTSESSEIPANSNLSNPIQTEKN